MPEDIFRKKYRQLNPDEVAAMQAIKDGAQALYDTMGEGKEMKVSVLVETNPEMVMSEQRTVAIDPRCMNRAKVKLEEAVMWATKAITG